MGNIGECRVQRLALLLGQSLRELFLMRTVLMMMRMRRFLLLMILGSL